MILEISVHIFISNVVQTGQFAEEDVGRQGIGVQSAAGNAAASRGLEVAVANLQDYCNGKSFIKLKGF